MTDNKRRNSLISKYVTPHKHTIEAEMSFFDHLEALRWHILRSIIAVAVLSVAAFAFSDFIFDDIIFGPKKTDFWTYRMMCEIGHKYNIEDFCVDRINFIIMNTELSGQFMLHFTGSLLVGVALAFPYFVWEIWRFIKPALHDAERGQATIMIFFSSALFLIGMLFGYFIVVPLTINFLGSYTVSEEILNQISLDSYISTIGTLTLGTGLTFELPMLIYFASRLGLVTPKFLRESRRYAIVIILILGAIITPSPDIITQLTVAAPLFILYELSIGVSAWVVRSKQKAAARNQ